MCAVGAGEYVDTGTAQLLDARTGISDLADDPRRMWPVEENVGQAVDARHRGRPGRADLILGGRCRPQRCASHIGEAVVFGNGLPQRSHHNRRRSQSRD